MKKYRAVFEYADKMWVAGCDELGITLEDGSFDALVVRVKYAIQDIAEMELGYKGDIQLTIVVRERVDVIKAVG